MPELIYDVGMFDGSDTARYLAMGHRVVAVEANPYYVDQARTRFSAEIAEGRLHVEPVGIAPSGEPLPFWIVTKMPWKSTFSESFARQVGGTEVEKITVQTSPLAQILERHGRGHYVKIDIEESDELCIGDLAGDLMPDYVSAEMGVNIGILDRLKEVGFEDFKCISQYSQLPLPVEELPNGATKARYQRLLESTAPPVRLARKLGLRTAVMRRLHPGRDDVSVFTSGDFGEMTGGKWKSYDDIHRYYAQYIADNAFGATWVDAHARAPHVTA